MHQRLAKGTREGALAFDLGRYKDHAETLQALMTILALLVAGIWTYMLFIQNRERAPKASLEHRIESVPLTRELILLRTTVKMTNIGKVLVSVTDMTVRVQQIMPLVGCGGDARCPMTLVRAGKGARAEEGAQVADWSILDAWSGEPDFELEPGETEILAFDFVIPATVQTIQIYSYLENWTKDRIGWKNYSIHTLGPLSSKATGERGSADARPEGGIHATQP